VPSFLSLFARREEQLMLAVSFVCSVHWNVCYSMSCCGAESPVCRGRKTYKIVAPEDYLISCNKPGFWYLSFLNGALQT